MNTKISNEELSAICLELSLLMRAGVGVSDALCLLAEENAEYREMLSGMMEQTDMGATLSTVMRDTGRFPAYLCGLVEVGERTGRTEEALSALANYYEERVRTGRRVRSALLYPAVMLALMLVVIGVLLVKVLPIFDDVYASLGGRLTGAAGGLLVLGRWLDQAMPVVWVILVIAAVCVALFSLVESLRTKAVSFWGKHFGDKGVARKLSAARVSQAMAMGIASGLPPEEAVALAARLEEHAAKARCLDCQARLEQGESLGAAMKASGMLPANQCRLLELGQKSGAGDVSMSRIAQKLTEDGEASLDALVSRVEPALVLVSSILVGLILLSVMLPLMHIMAAIG